MRLRWKRVNHWKNIRMLVADEQSEVFAYIQRGRRPNEFTLVFPKVLFTWTMRHLKGPTKDNRIPSVEMRDSTLAAAKAVGMLIAKTQDPRTMV